ncbi:hypothetical protein HDU85_001474 [Gaertneriomyces sp. JEL0708]|nr:hypothetical protein HDU85_001474 [Gaertneriomyces sp. JEL0708]
MSDAADYEKQIYLLEQRLAHLEALTAPNLISISESGRSRLQGSLLRSLQGIEEKLGQIAEERRPIGDFLQKYDLVKDVVGAHTASNVEAPSLDIVSKRDIVLAAEENLAQLTRELQETQDLAGELDSPILHGLDHMFARMTGIDATHMKLSHKEKAARDNLDQVLHRYNLFVELLSNLFIWYDEFVGDLERQVLHMERQLKTPKA